MLKVKMKATCSLGTTRRYDTEARALHSHRRGKLKSSSLLEVKLSSSRTRVNFCQTTLRHTPHTTRHYLSHAKPQISQIYLVSHLFWGVKKVKVVPVLS
jgi:hypothetical protein